MWGLERCHIDVQVVMELMSYIVSSLLCMSFDVRTKFFHCWIFKMNSIVYDNNVLDVLLKDIMQMEAWVFTYGGYVFSFFGVRVF